MTDHGLEAGRAEATCPVERTLQIIGSKWTLLILRDLLAGTRRFGELRRSLGHVSPKTLSERLKELERQGLVTRKVYPEVPPRVEYSLTEKGRSLGDIIEAMRAWGERWGDLPGRQPQLLERLRVAPSGQPPVSGNTSVS